MPLIRYATLGSTALVTLARPDKRNALSPDSIRELKAALERAAGDRAVRAVLLSAEGADFCAGADLEALAEMVDAPPDTHRADARSLADLFLAMRSLPKPIVAAVQGRALAGGAGLVTACDIAIAADDAVFGYPEVRIGFVAAVVMALLRECAGEKAAFELLATGKQISAAEAARLGLITRTVPRAELDEVARRLADEIAALPPEAVARTKNLFYDISALPLGEAFENAIEANVSARTTAEFRAGLTGFLSRRRGGSS